MGKVYFGFTLTLLVSLLVLLAGGWISRRTVTRVTKLDRKLMNELAGQVEREAAVWAKERKEELESFAFDLSRSQPTKVEERLAEIPGVKGAYLFRAGRRSREWVLFGTINERSPAEVVQEGSKLPLNPQRAVVIPEGIFENAIFGQSGRLENDEGTFHGWWISPLQESVILYLIDRDQAAFAMTQHLREVLAGVWREVTSSGELMEVRWKGQLILGNGPGDRSASIEKGSRDFTIKGWDRSSEGREFHWPTMNGATALAVIIAGVGAILFVSQRKMWRESQEKVSFVNRVSHELGTPLTNMTLNLELAARSLRTKPEVAGRRLEKVREEVLRLGRLVNNVLAYSGKSPELNRQAPTHCHPDEVVAGVIDQFRPALDRRGVEVEWTRCGMGEIGLDGDALSQIIWNLISNVEKYGASGKWLGVRAEVSESFLTVEVMDRGPGIPEGHRDHIFGSFERVCDSTREGVSGTGLGLSISRELAHQMGGSLDLVDREGMTVFQLKVPLVR